MFESLLPQIPTLQTTFVYLSGILGAVILIYSQFVEAENRRDLFRMVGSAGLFVYALIEWNIIFMIASGGIFVAALIEFIEIYTGYHKHLPGDVKEYIRYYKKQKK